MGIIDLFSKKKQDKSDEQKEPQTVVTPTDDNNTNDSDNEVIVSTPTPQRDEKADLEKLLAIDKKLERNREIREAQIQKKKDEENISKNIKIEPQKPEEIRARQALSIKNPYRGV